ncbi:MAG: hypothetical protein WAX33_05300 [Rectinemataceae bacterium]
MKSAVLFASMTILSVLTALAPVPAEAQARQEIQSPKGMPIKSDSSARVPVVQLVERAVQYDGTEVEIEGEIIGDLMSRGDHAWLSILDGGTAVGVWATAEDITVVSFLGRYSTRGDRLRVRGVMHRACPEHGGDLDIHATSVEVVERGRAEFHPVNAGRLMAAIMLSATGGGLLVFWRRRERKVKKP